MSRETYTKIGYMCSIDFDYELGHACGGNKIYPSVEDLKRHHDFESCGIVEVEVRYIRTIREENFNFEDE